MRRLSYTALLAGGALAAFGGSAATGQETAKPAPGCNGISVTDKKGDAEPANADVINAFFDMAGGKPVVNVTVQTLDDGTPEAASGVRWYILWTFDGAERYVAASKVTAAGADPVFTYGNRDADGFHTEGNTDGAFFEGPDGVIQVVIPPEVGGDPNMKLVKPKVETFSSIGVPGVAQSGTAIDSTGSGKDYVIGACPAVAPPPTTPAPPSGGGTATPTTPTGDGRLHVALSGKPKRKGKVLSIGLRSTEAVTNITASLRKGSKTVARGKLARLAGRGTLKLKARGALKKGSYVLKLHGINADGSAGQLSPKVRVR